MMTPSKIVSLFFIALQGYTSVYAFSLNSSILSYKRSENGAILPSRVASSPLPSGLCMGHNDSQEDNRMLNGSMKAVSSLAVAMALTISTSFGNTANAYDDYEDATETISTVVSNLKSAAKAGDATATLTEFENIAAIITEGKGVGGSISNYGVKLNRGFVADEDTAIYNPGLSLLTESEKDSIISAIVDTRKTLVAKGGGAWNTDNQYGYDFLKEKLDPLHMVELRGYLGVLPIYGAILYIGAFAVQQFAREAFPAAYIGSVVAIFLPIFVLVLIGA
eukprot:CAMPEP_0197832728 /NCGR_PEP_ID=MMETSP1437-20131217/15855_1 /TAXON_ID=49252 ORGANISM="Eucampia antarctica, Strain CCMP1452" /NCGR_SAMPLE_ID=MMETSP1437 /ASSEMBLY_ACC=CAM_ASM_001096 /LENGTH=277 /DNA_ID=CAMNT_0043436267 /DNA_START=84 /DNA_END=917 /DNA_ORIENTATION=+